MSHNFRVGEEIVCKVGGTWTWDSKPCPPEDQPEKGRVYKIDGISPSEHQHVACFLHLAEFPGGCVYGSNGFEPVVTPKTEASIGELRKLLMPAPPVKTRERV